MRGQRLCTMTHQISTIYSEILKLFETWINMFGQFVSFLTENIEFFLFLFIFCSLTLCSTKREILLVSISLLVHYNDLKLVQNYWKIEICHFSYLIIIIRLFTVAIDWRNFERKFRGERHRTTFLLVEIVMFNFRSWKVGTRCHGNF